MVIKTLEIHVGGGGGLCLGNPDGRGRGVQRSLEIQVGGRSKNVAIHGGGWIFSRIIHFYSQRLN